MLQDSKWVFSNAQTMPNAGTAVTTNYIDWTSNKWKDFINTSMPLWLVVTCNTVASGGTSIQVLFYQHSGADLASGELLLSGRTFAIADLSVDPFDPGHWLFCVPLISCLCSVQAADRDRYCGLVLSGSGDVSSGKVDAWLHIGANPPIPVAQPAIAGGSNIVMPA